MSTSAVILAAGHGHRMQAEVNKVLLPIQAQPLICWTVRAFVRIAEIDELVLVVQAQETKAIRQAIGSTGKHVQFVEGGPTRRDSALAGVRAAQGSLVLIHDGARPFASEELIRQVMIEASRSRAAIPVLQVSDLLHQLSSDGSITQLPPCKSHVLARAQTPQGFHRELILRCLESAPQNIRDDATAVIRAGVPVATTAGEWTNVKITKTNDLAIAKLIAEFLET